MMIQAQLSGIFLARSYEQGILPEVVQTLITPATHSMSPQEATRLLKLSTEELVVQLKALAPTSSIVSRLLKTTIWQILFDTKASSGGVSISLAEKTA